MINVSSEISKLQQLTTISVNESHRWCIHWLIVYKHLSEKVRYTLLGIGMSEEDIIAVSEDDKQTLEFIKSTLGYVILPEHFYDSWVDKCSDFSYGDITTALRNFERLNVDADSTILQSIAIFKSKIQHISKHNSEITGFIRTAMSRIYDQEA